MFFVRVLRFRGIDGLVIRPNEGEADGNESCETERCSQGRVYGSDGELRVDNRLAFVNDVLSATGCSEGSTLSATNGFCSNSNISWPASLSSLDMIAP